MLSRFFAGVLLLQIAGSVGPAMGDEPSPPKFSWEPRKAKDDGVEPSFLADTVVFSVSHGTGIGGGDLKLAAGRWPKKVVLRFLKFPALEGFSADANNIRLSAFLRHNDNQAVFFFDQQGKAVEDSAKAAWQLTFRRINDPQAIEIELPADFVSGTGKALRLDWVDAYR